VSDRGLIASSGWTDLVIGETYRFKVADALLSGFHDATATHLSMLRAFMDAELLDAAYSEALERGYACHEFGDTHLIE
jgi:S-adenosylmethionine:tRNA ribosyltransferase-isomerase